jgi:hypothetical protein
MSRVLFLFFLVFGVDKGGFFPRGGGGGASFSTACEGKAKAKAQPP